MTEAKKPRKAPNKREPRHRPTDPVVLQKVKDHLRAEYLWLKENEKELERKRKAADVASDFADPDASKIFVPVYQRMMRGMHELYMILGRGQAEVEHHQKAQVSASPLAKKLGVGDGPWPVNLSDKDQHPPTGKTRRGDPTSPKNLILQLGLEFLYIDEVAEIMEVSEGAVRTFMSQAWEK